MKKRIIFCVSVMLCLLVFACKKSNPITTISVYQPSNFPAPVYDLQSNPVTVNGFVLGRKLFYDPILSRNNTISCGNCHQQFASFVHAGHNVSHGIDDKLGKRNTPAIVNMAWSKDFFWDGGVHSLDLVPPNPIHNPVEMDEDFAHVLQKLQATSTYPKLFKDAFGSEQITSVHFLQALSQFMLTLVTADSRYDEYRRGNANALSQDELTGMNLFHQKCAKCHEGDLTTDRGYHNNGTQATITDSGRYAITLNPDDIGKFKTPTLRNIEKTAPYMHTGRFNTLEQVLQHYASGTTYTATLDTALIAGTQYGISMTANEQQKIILFLKTLTDDKFLHDQRFAEQ